ncbi:MAG TPA: hypothetical protein VMG81_01115 [Thermoplasmata archaeon]|nr:hypothetical protein [Thermoplasmata archaeon]
MKATDWRRFAVTFAVVAVALMVFSVLGSANIGAMPAGGSPSGGTSAAASAPSVTASTAPAASASTAATSPATCTEPHNCEIQSYLLAPGGTTSLDPSVAYYTVPYETILNVYQSLITFNGTQTGPNPSNWTPVLAACTPGSVQCTSEFGSSLVVNNQYYTFVLDGGAQFYDPSTGAHWGVYPSDVMFSLARTMSFGNLPYEEFYNGWIQEQWALPAGNATWDGGIHGLFNNTPQNILSSMLVNDSTYCPASAMVAPYNGCITMDTGASGQTWPYFLELIGDSLGASVTPCGWFTAQDAGLPGFYSSAANGDGPCLLPGNVTSTSDPGFSSWLSSTPATAWDAVQELAASAPESPQPNVQYAMVGSGPYFLVPGSAAPGGGAGGVGGYTLGTNPYYTQPIACTGVTGGAFGCEPPAGSYIPNVVQTYENDDTIGVQALIGGTASTASWDPSHTPTIKQLVSEGKYDLLTNISGGTANWFMPFEEQVNLTNEHAIDPTGKFNVPTNFLEDNGLRNFLTQAYPYATIQNTVWTVDGLQTTVQYGGAIPPGQSTYYPSNITWPYLNNGGVPNTNPNDVDGAAWWWAQITNPSSPVYDAQAAACSSSSPCQWPIIGWVGNPSLDNAITDWIDSVSSLTGGALQPYSFDLVATGQGFYGQIAYGQGNGSMPVYNWGWVADYNDPTDFFLPMWQPNGTYTFAMGTYPAMYQAETNSASCGHDELNNYTDLIYWANYPDNAIPTSCEGVAYQVMNAWINADAHEANQAERTLTFNLVEHIGNELALMVYVYCNLANYVYGPWLSPTGINVNPAVGAAETQTWYTWTYASNVFSATFTESGLPSGTSWSVTLAGVAKSSTSTTIQFTGETNGTYPYTVTYSAGYAASPASGSVVINGANAGVSVAFTAIPTPTYPLTISESGLVAGTPWGVTLADVGAQTTTGTSVTFQLAAGTYNYTLAPVIGYSTPSPGETTLASPGQTVQVTYVAQSTATYAVNFQEVGLPVNMSTGENAPWGVTMSGVTYDSITNWNNFTVLNGTYTFALLVPSGFTPAASTGFVVVNGADINVLVPLSPAGASFATTFTETGLPAGASWTVTLNGFGQSGTGTTIVFAMPNGTYNWSTTTIGGYTTSPWSGTVSVSGAVAGVTVAFVQFTYPVTFFEDGLPSGSSWSVTAGGATYTSTTYYLTVNLPNGTNAFTAAGPSGYVATPTQGGVLVSAAPASQVILFAEEFAVTFTETGLPSGSSWSVYFSDQPPLTGTGSTLSALSPNGTFGYGVAGPSGYYASGGTVTVSGAATGVTVSFSKTSSSSGIDSTTGLSTLAYALIGLFVLLTVVFLVLAITARRKQPPASPPQSWSADNESTNQGEGSQSPPPSS